MPGWLSASRAGSACPSLTISRVDCSGPLLTLLERRLIATAGRAKRPGSPLLYRTTREFLRYFGLETLEDLPPLEQLGAFLADALEGRRPEAERREVESLAIDPRAGVEEADPAPDHPLPAE